MRLRVRAFVSAIAALLLTSATIPAGAQTSRGGATPSRSVQAATDHASIMQAEDLAHQGQPFRDNPAALPAHPYVAGPAPAVATTRARANTVYNAGGLNREVLGFAPYWALSNGDLGDLQYDKVSSITYFGLTFDSNGNVVPDSGYAGWTSGALNTLVSQAHAAGDKALVTFKSFSSPDIYNIAVNHAQNSYGNIVSALNQKGLDGVNVDFEGTTSGMPPDIQQRFTSWVQGLRQYLNANRPGTILSVDSYSGSASWDQGFFRIDTLAPWVDYFFIMAYDMGLSNASAQGLPDTLPNAPLAGNYTYYDTLSVDQYVSKAGDVNKVVLGVPYYGYKFSTSGTGFNSPLSATCDGTNWACADPYSGIQADFACAQQLSPYRWDQASSTPWRSWYSPASGDPCGGNHNSWRELYYDDAGSIGAKYDLVNNRNIRGSGMWALGYDHGSTDLWAVIGAKFVCSALQINDISPASSGVTGGQALISGCAFNTDASNTPPTVTFGGVAASVTYLSHTQLKVIVPPRSLGAVDVVVTNPAGAGGASTRRALGFTYAANGYTLDGWGGVHQYGGASPVSDSSHAYWTGWDIAKAVAVCPGGQSGYTLDGWGGVHGYGGVPAVSDSSHAYWPGWDIARGIALTQCSPSSVQGYILDGYGGLHAFGTPSKPPDIADGSQGFYWPGWDIARGITICPAGVGGYVLDGWGGVHAFGGASAVSDGSHAYWAHWDIARGIATTTCTGGGSAGYTLDGWGGVHAFGSAPGVPDSSHAYWPYWDIARGITWVPGLGGGYVVDGWGGVHPFVVGAGPQPDLTPGAYWPRWDIARSIGSG